MRPTLRAFLISTTLAFTTLTAGTAFAGVETGKIVIGEGPASLATNDNGVLTSEGEKSVIKELDRIPGEDDWDMRLHARLGKYAAEGPLYVEFFQTVNDKEYPVWNWEDPNYDGSRHYTMSILLEANVGFNKNREYRVVISQNNGKRDLTLAEGKIKLVDTGREPEPVEGDGGEEGDGPSEQDILDTLAGPDDDGGDDDDGGGDDGDAIDEAPPPVEPSKKGCSVDSDLDLGFSGVMVLMLVALATRRRED